MNKLSLMLLFCVCITSCAKKQNKQALQLIEVDSIAEGSIEDYEFRIKSFFKNKNLLDKLEGHEVSKCILIQSDFCGSCSVKDVESLVKMDDFMTISYPIYVIAGKNINQLSQTFPNNSQINFIKSNTYLMTKLGLHQFSSIYFVFKRGKLINYQEFNADSMDDLSSFIQQTETLFVP